MALLHHAQLVPSKLDLIAAWLPSQPFWPADADPTAISRIASFRFDDPAGEVGVETLLVGAGEHVLQVPLTYRNDRLDGADGSLIGTTEHSVLGTRWVYDGPADPVYLAEVVHVAVTGGTEVEQHYEEDGARVTKPGDAHVRGSGHPGDALPEALTGEQEPVADARLTSDTTTTVSRWRGLEVAVRRRVASSNADDAAGAPALVGDWTGASGAVLVTVAGGTPRS
ncbi:maltokinase N-terminal cap-like domain-containing protein [Rathayibacter sp. CAU 1779]